MDEAVAISSVLGMHSPQGDHPLAQTNITLKSDSHIKCNIYSCKHGNDALLICEQSQCILCHARQRAVQSQAVLSPGWLALQELLSFPTHTSTPLPGKLPASVPLRPHDEPTELAAQPQAT